MFKVMFLFACLGPWFVVLVLFCSLGMALAD